MMQVLCMAKVHPMRHLLVKPYLYPIMIDVDSSSKIMGELIKVTKDVVEPGSIVDLAWYLPYCNQPNF